VNTSMNHQVPWEVGNVLSSLAKATVSFSRRTLLLDQKRQGHACLITMQVLNM
jgi:hypothetical protein